MDDLISPSKKKSDHFKDNKHTFEELLRGNDSLLVRSFDKSLPNEAVVEVMAGTGAATWKNDGWKNEEGIEAAAAPRAAAPKPRAATLANTSDIVVCSISHS